MNLAIIFYSRMRKPKLNCFLMIHHVGNSNNQWLLDFILNFMVFLFHF